MVQIFVSIVEFTKLVMKTISNMQERGMCMRRFEKAEQKETACGVFISNMSLMLKTLPLSATTPNTKKTFLDSQRCFDRLKNAGLDLQTQAVFDTVLSCDLCHYHITGRKAGRHRGEI